MANLIRVSQFFLLIELEISASVVVTDVFNHLTKQLTVIGKQWRDSAAACGLNREEQNKMAPAFALCEKLG